MKLSKHWNLKFNCYLKRGCGLAPVFLFILLSTLSAGAKELFSKQYGLTCKQCHTKIPNLKEFGQNFKNNGYSLEKRVPVPNVTPVGVESTVVQQQISSVANTRKKTNEKSKDDLVSKLPSSPQPDAPESFYRLRSKDGSYVFTEQPIRTFGTYNADKTMETVITSKKSLIQDVNSSKTAFSEGTKEKRHKGSTDSVKSSKMRKRDSLEHSVAQINEALPHNFEECMEKILIKIDQPKNGKEAMELFEKAERNCAHFAAR